MEAKVIRLSLRELDKKCNQKKKNDFLKAWKLIQELPPSNPNSFWAISSYHGMPFKQRRVSLGPDEKAETWGGYCQHGNVLFPFWHRFYCLRLEQALQSVLKNGIERVALHYWDASSKESMSGGLPHIVTDKSVYIDGKKEPNPLFKFKLPKPIEDDVSTTDEDSQLYKKEAGYETCRYPYSGIRNPDKAKMAALSHNTAIDGRNETAQSLLQANIIGWLSKGGRKAGGVAEQLKDCLDTTDYNRFSNTTSAHCCDVPLEQPHNDLHLAIGGFAQPETNEDESVKRDAKGNVIWKGIEGANGDMCANEVASHDPVFFLHHSNIDRMFWIWQKKYKKTNPSKFTIDNSNEEDKGISNSTQGATPNQTWGQKLNEDTILYPFQDEYGVPRTSKDGIDIVSQLGYDYSICSLDQDTWPEPEEVIPVTLEVEPSTSWTKIVTELNGKITTMFPYQGQGQRQRVRMMFDRTQLTTPAFIKVREPESDEMRAMGANIGLHGRKTAMSYRAIPTCPTGPIPDTIEGLPFKFKNFVQVKDIDKDNISGSFLVQVFYRAHEKVYYLGQQGVLSRWNRGNCANCQGRRMAHISIPITGCHIAAYDPDNLEVHLVHKDGMTGKNVRKMFAGQTLVVPAAAKRVPGEQKPSLRIFGSFLLN